MSVKSKSRQDEALQLLDDLEIPDVSGASGPSARSPPNAVSGNDGDAEVLAFIDEITQKSSEPTKTTLDRPISRSGTPTVRKSTERVRLGGGGSGILASSSSKPVSQSVTPPTDATSPSAWGWGSVWSTASAAIQQAKTVVDEQVKHLPQGEQAQKWTEGIIGYAKSAQLDKFGQDFRRAGLSTLTDILNVVAPPISEHEVIQVWLSHDLMGYDGIESLVYRALARILEQVKGGDLVVNRGQESRPKDGAVATGGRELNSVNGYNEAIKLSQANLAELMKTKSEEIKQETVSEHNPVSYSHIYLRIQPFLAEDVTGADRQRLQFLLYLEDPLHELSHSTITQAVPATWLDMWDEHEWIEDLIAEALRVGVEVIGQEYLVSRMGWIQATESANVQETQDSKQPEGDNVPAADS